MANEPNIARILIQLDALLDTRFGTLALMNPEGGEALIKAGYHSRQVDIFDGYDTKQYRELYAKRDKTTLMHSLPTKMMLLLRQMVDALDEQTIVRPYHTGVEVVVNCYPYELEEEDKVTIAETVSFWTKDLAPVKVVTLADKDLSPQFCKDQFGVMIFYDFADWFKMHVAQMASVRLVDIQAFIPSIMAHADEKTYKDDLEKYIRDVAHPEMALDVLTKMLIGLQIVGTEWFSFADIDKLALASGPTVKTEGAGAG